MPTVVHVATPPPTWLQAERGNDCFDFSPSIITCGVLRAYRVEHAERDGR
jgi:hypothetical protein